MMNFRDFINPTRKPVQKAQIEDVEEMEDFEPKEVQKPVRPAPQRRVQPKVVEQYEEPEEYDEPVDEDEEYYEEPVVYVPPQRQVQRVQPRQQVRPQHRPVARPTRPVHNGYAMPDAEFRRPLVVSPKQLKENTIEGTANSLTEAIKRKVDTVFYRFGIQGLEKLDEKILDTIEELQYPEQKQTKRPLREMRRQPVRKPVKKYRPLPLEEVPPVPQEPVYEEPVYQEPISYEDPIVDDEHIEETSPEAISEPPVEEIVEKPIEHPPQPKKSVESPKPSFLQPKKVEKPKQLESTGDEDEDLINAAMSMDFSEQLEEQKPVVSDEEIWGEVEAILETEPSQKLVHEPQTQSQLVTPPTQVEEHVETPEVQEKPTEEPKPKKKRKKTEETKIEENITNEKE